MPPPRWQSLSAFHRGVGVPELLVLGGQLLAAFVGMHGKADHGEYAGKHETEGRVSSGVNVHGFTPSMWSSLANDETLWCFWRADLNFRQMASADSD